MPVQKEHRTREENDLERVSERQVDAGEHQLLDGRDIAGETGGDGWLVVIEVTDAGPLEGLMDAGAYRAFVEQQTD